MQTQNADTHRTGIVYKKMLGYYNVHQRPSQRPGNHMYCVI